MPIWMATTIKVADVSANFELCRNACVTITAPSVGIVYSNNNNINNNNNNSCHQIYRSSLAIIINTTSMLLCDDLIDYDVFF